MTVTVNATTENLRTGTTSPQTFSHAGAASGVNGVLLAIVHGTSATDHVSAASYGGVAMTRVQRNTDSATEPGAAEWWFLGAGVPQGTQTVSYTPGATTDDIHAVCITLLADGDLAVVDSDGVNDNVANPSVTLQYNGRTCMAFGALYGGGAAPTDFTPNANCTTVIDEDLGAFYSEIIRQTTAGSTDFAIGGTSGTDDVAFAAVAVSEKVVGADAASTAAASTSVVGAALWNTLSSSVALAASAVVAATLVLATGASSGMGAAAGVGGYVTAGEASSAGVAATSAVGASFALGTGSSAGVATVDGAGQATALTSASASGAAAGSGAGAALNEAAGSSAGVAATSVVAAAFGTTVASSSGTGTASADGENANSGGGIIEAEGTASGLGATSGISATLFAALAQGSGSGSASGASEAITPIRGVRGASHADPENPERPDEPHHGRRSASQLSSRPGSTSSRRPRQ